MLATVNKFIRYPETILIVVEMSYRENKQKNSKYVPE